MRSNPIKMTPVMTAILAAVMLVVGAGSGSGQSVDPSGDWDLTIHVQQDSIDWEVTFEHEGGTLGGTLVIGRDRIPIEGTLKGTRLEFSFIQEDEDGDFPITMSGQVDGDTITGEETSFGLFGESTWSAARRTKN